MLVAEKSPITKIINVTKQNNSLIFNTENGILMLEICTPSIIRIVYTLKDNIDFNKGVAFIQHNDNQIAWDYEETTSEVIIKTSDLLIKICKSTSFISYFDKDGKPLLKESNKNSKELIPYDFNKTIFDEESSVKRIETPDGVKEILTDSSKVFEKVSYHSRVNFDFGAEALYGLGQHEEGNINLRGKRIFVHQANMKIGIPMFLSTNGYGLLFDNYSPIIFNDNEYGSYVYCESSQQLDYYFIGGNFDEIISNYRYLTGTASMLPKWSFGFIQSLERYESSEELINTVKEYNRRNIPIDCIVLDWHSWENNMWGQKSYDKERFPDPKAMVEELHRLGTKFMISIWPNMTRKSDNYKEMEKAGLLLPQSEIYDAYSEDGRKLYWEQANKGLFQYGVDGWWCDSSEPFTPEWNEKIKPEADENYIKFRDIASTYMDPELSNSYALFHAQGIYEGQRETTEEKRVVNLTRSGYIGQQKYGVILWSGDISATWDTLKKQIPAGLNMCASGMPYWTLDIGAFFTKNGKPWFWNGDFEDGNKDLGYRELYARWYQLGAFLPIFRSHGTDTRREIWNFGDEGDMFYSTIKEFTLLRYKFMPYIYSLAGSVHFNHDTIMRFLAFDFPKDNNVYEVGDQYMFGRNVMVCPITTPMYYTSNSTEIESTKEREVYLPEGTSWYDFWTNKLYDGGQKISANATIDTMPLYIKAGSIMPFSAKDKDIDLVVYPGHNATFELYLDEEDNYNYENGKYAFIKLFWNDEKSELIIDSLQGDLSVIPSTMDFNITIIGYSCDKQIVNYNGERLVCSNVQR